MVVKLWERKLNTTVDKEPSFMYKNQMILSTKKPSSICIQFSYRNTTIF